MPEDKTVTYFDKITGTSRMITGRQAMIFLKQSKLQKQMEKIYTDLNHKTSEFDTIWQAAIDGVNKMIEEEYNA